MTRDTITWSADDYRNDRGALGNLTDGLQRLCESAVKLAASDAREVVARFGQLGGRPLAMAGSSHVAAYTRKGGPG